MSLIFFFFNDTATTEIYTLSLHDALPIFASGHTDRSRLHKGTACGGGGTERCRAPYNRGPVSCAEAIPGPSTICLRSEEHTSELQSRQYLVCRLLLEKKKKQTKTR